MTVHRLRHLAAVPVDAPPAADDLRDRAVRAVSGRPGGGAHEPVEVLDLAPLDPLGDGSVLAATLVVGGTPRPVVLKRLGSAARGRRVGSVRPSGPLDACREPFVYRDVLPDVPGPPMYLGHQLDPDGRDGVLVLARVDGMELGDVDLPEVWADTARWLGRFHSTPTLRPVPSSVLVSYDAHHLAALAGRVRRAAAAGGPGARSLASIAEVFERDAVRPLLAAPTTFVHGDLDPSDVIVGGARPDGTVNALRHRVAVVDWDSAGIGPALLDLAALLARRPFDEREPLVQAYAEAAPAFAGEGFRTTLAACRLALAVEWLGWAGEGDPLADTSDAWMSEAVDACRALVTF